MMHAENLCNVVPSTRDGIDVEHGSIPFTVKKETEDNGG
jgi:hypothetical protein